MAEQVEARKRPVTVPGNLDLGLGYCYRCVQYLTVQDVNGRATRYVPRFALTTAPWPMPELGVVIALPVCYDCLTGRGEAGAPGSGIVTANGRLPGH
jgi:hypothetical protein